MMLYVRECPSEVGEFRACLEPHRSILAPRERPSQFGKTLMLHGCLKADGLGVLLAQRLAW